LTRLEKDWNDLIERTSVPEHINAEKLLKEGCG